MHRHAVFGRCLESEFRFPELRASAHPSPAWSVSLAPPDEGANAGELLGEGTETPCRVALYRVGGDLALRHSCTGTFRIADRGSRIVWHRRRGATLERGRADVLGRVLAVAMHEMGYLSLHASAVAIDGRAVAFLAPKGCGKSTLATAVASAGGRLVSDDTLPVWPGEVPTVAEGIQRARLHGDAAVHLLERSRYSRAGRDGKHLSRLPAHQIWTGSAPLAALYVLAPNGTSGPPVSTERRLLPLRPAAMIVAGHAKVGALLGREMGGAMLSRAADLVRAVPVHELVLPWSLDVLHEVVAKLLLWHSTGVMVRDRAS